MFIYNKIHSSAEFLAYSLRALITPMAVVEQENIFLSVFLTIDTQRYVPVLCVRAEVEITSKSTSGRNALYQWGRVSGEPDLPASFIHLVSQLPVYGTSNVAYHKGRKACRKHPNPLCGARMHACNPIRKSAPIQPKVSRRRRKQRG